MERVAHTLQQKCALSSLLEEPSLVPYQRQDKREGVLTLVSQGDAY